MSFWLSFWREIQDASVIFLIEILKERTYLELLTSYLYGFSKNDKITFLHGYLVLTVQARIILDWVTLIKILKYIQT